MRYSQATILVFVLFLSLNRPPPASSFMVVKNYSTLPSSISLGTHAFVVGVTCVKKVSVWYPSEPTK